MSLYWILKEGSPIETDLETWAKWMENAKNRVLAQEDVGDYLVSTVFLGYDLDPNVGRPPLLWETMIFSKGSSKDLWALRSPTFIDAWETHRHAVDLAREGDESLWDN